MSYKIPVPYVLPVVIPDASPTSDGVMTSTQAAKLDAIAHNFIWKFGTPWTDVQPLFEANKPCVVSFDPLGQTGLVQFDITAGAWDLSQILFDGSNMPVGVAIQLNFAPGATMSVPTLSLKDIFFLVDHPLYSGPLVGALDLTGGIVERLVACAGPIWNSHGVSIVATNGTIFNDDAAFFMFTADAQSLLALDGLSSATGDIFNGTVPATPVQVNIDVQAAITVATAIGPSATPTVILLGESANVHYAPTAGLFVAPDPVNVQDGMNRMAALLKTLNGGLPIP